MCIYICILAFPALSKCCSDSVRGTGQGGAPATVHKVYLHLELKELYSRSGAKKKKKTRTGLARWTEPEDDWLVKEERVRASGIDFVPLLYLCFVSFTGSLYIFRFIF